MAVVSNFPNNAEAPSAPPSWARAFGVEDACVYLGGIHRSSLYRLVRDDKLRLRKIGGRSVFLREDLDALLDGEAS